MNIFFVNSIADETAFATIFGYFRILSGNRTWRLRYTFLKYPVVKIKLKCILNIKFKRVSFHEMSFMKKIYFWSNWHARTKHFSVFLILWHPDLCTEQLITLRALTTQIAQRCISAVRYKNVNSTVDENSFKRYIF